MRIRITKPGIYRNGTDMIPVGTELDVPDGFQGWANKYEVVSSADKLEVATPTIESRPDDSDPGEQVGGFESDDLNDLREQYERITGERPHGRMKADTLRARIQEAE